MSKCNLNILFDMLEQLNNQVFWKKKKLHILLIKWIELAGNRSPPSTFYFRRNSDANDRFKNLLITWIIIWHFCFVFLAGSWEFHDDLFNFRVCRLWFRILFRARSNYIWCLRSAPLLTNVFDPIPSTITNTLYKWEISDPRKNGVGFPASRKCGPPCILRAYN